MVSVILLKRKKEAAGWRSGGPSTLRSPALPYLGYLRFGELTLACVPAQK